MQFQFVSLIVIMLSTAVIAGGVTTEAAATKDSMAYINGIREAYEKDAIASKHPAAFKALEENIRKASKEKENYMEQFFLKLLKARAVADAKAVAEARAVGMNLVPAATRIKIAQENAEKSAKHLFWELRKAGYSTSSEEELSKAASENPAVRQALVESITAYSNLELSEKALVTPAEERVSAAFQRVQILHLTEAELEEARNEFDLARAQVDAERTAANAKA